MAVSFGSMFSTFLASIKSIGTAVTLASVGIYLHRRGFIGSEGKRTLALISQQVTFPLFLFTKILYCNQDWSDKPCPDVTQSLKDVWVLLFWPFFAVGIGIFVGWCIAKITNTPSKQVRPVIAACCFGNSTGLPITLLTVIHANFPSSSDLGRIDPTLFLSVYLLLYPVLQWGIGGWMLAPDTDTDSSEGSFSENEADEEKGLLTTNDTNRQSTTVSPPKRHSRGRSLDLVAGSLRQNVLNNIIGQELYKSHNRGLSSADEGLYVSELDLQQLLKEQEELEISKSKQPTTVEPKIIYGSIPESKLPSSFEKDGLMKTTTKQKINFTADTICENIKHVLDRCLQPPVIGSILGIICAVTPLRGVLVDLDRSSQAPLQWLFDGLYAVGLTAVPINMIILGCNLSASEQTRSKQQENSLLDSGDGLLPMNTSIGIVIGKMIILPFIGILSAVVLKNFVWHIPDEIDGSFYLVIMIVFLCPTANNVMVMVELSGSNAKEGIARVIAMQYAVAPFILSLTMSIAIGVASAWS